MSVANLNSNKDHTMGINSNKQRNNDFAGFEALQLRVRNLLLLAVTNNIRYVTLSAKTHIPYSGKFWWEETLANCKLLLHLVKKILTDLSPASIALSDITSNWRIKLW